MPRNAHLAGQTDFRMLAFWLFRYSSIPPSPKKTTGEWFGRVSSRLGNFDWTIIQFRLTRGI